MFCEKCGTKNLENSNYCEKCGTELKNNVILNKTLAYANPGTSYFDGTLLGLIGWRLLGTIITILTLGLCFPLAICLVYNWEISHTVINGRRLKFDGKAIQLFSLWLKWVLLTVITLGIYSLWIPISLKKWQTKHTYFMN